VRKAGVHRRRRQLPHAAVQGNVDRRGFLIRYWLTFEPDAGVLGNFAFVVGVQLLEPLTGKLWTLDDFEGNPALQVSHSFCIACAKCIYLQLVTEETPLCIIYSTGC